MHRQDVILRRTYQVAFWLTLLVGLSATAWGVPSTVWHVQEVSAIRNLKVCQDGPQCASNLTATVKKHLTGSDSDGNTAYYLGLSLPDGTTSQQSVGQAAYNAVKDGDKVAVTAWRDHITSVSIGGVSIDTTGEEEGAAYTVMLVGLLGLLSLVAAAAIAVVLRARLYINDIEDYTPPIGVPLAVCLVVGLFVGGGLLISPYALYIGLGLVIPAIVIEVFLLRESLAKARSVRNRSNRRR